MMKCGLHIQSLTCVRSIHFSRNRRIQKKSPTEGVELGDAVIRPGSRQAKADGWVRVSRFVLRASESLVHSLRRDS